jgi:hypothetical protein
MIMPIVVADYAREGDCLPLPPPWLDDLVEKIRTPRVPRAAGRQHYRVTWRLSFYRKSGPVTEPELGSPAPDREAAQLKTVPLGNSFFEPCVA